MNYQEDINLRIAEIKELKRLQADVKNSHLASKAIVNRINELYIELIVLYRNREVLKAKNQSHIRLLWVLRIVVPLIYLTPCALSIWDIMEKAPSLTYEEFTPFFFLMCLFPVGVWYVLDKIFEP